jgi:hypothetical protein
MMKPREKLLFLSYTSHLSGRGTFLYLSIYLSIIFRGGMTGPSFPMSVVVMAGTEQASHRASTGSHHIVSGPFFVCTASPPTFCKVLRLCGYR